MVIAAPVTYPDLFLNPVTSKYPIALGSLVLNSVDAAGNEWTVATFDGWGGPPSTVKFTDRARQDGATATEAFYGPRTMTITGQVSVSDPASLSTVEDTLNAAVTLSPFQLSVSERGRHRWCMVQRQSEVIVRKLNEYDAYFSIQIVAKDPHKYGDLITASTGLPSSSGGLTYPLTYPITYTGSSNTGVIRIINPGNVPAPVWLRVDGRLVDGGWSVNHLRGTTPPFSSSLALGVGEFVTVDMQKREVLAQGQATRNGYVTSRGWFQLDPGPNDIAFTAVGYDPTALLTVSTYPAWS